MALADIGAGVTPVFSPRTGSAVLDLYADLVDAAQDLSCITLAFGIGRVFKLRLQNNTPNSHVAFFLLERRDVENPNSTQPFINLNARNNVYEAWGSFLREPLHQWARETWTKALQLNKHVAFVHLKFLLADPLGDDPVVVTGSANFSDASTNDNDENMLVIRGDRRVADIYFTEFNRLFNHFYFRRCARRRTTSPPHRRRRRTSRACSSPRPMRGCPSTGRTACGRSASARSPARRSSRQSAPPARRIATFFTVTWPRHSSAAAGE